MTQWFSRNAAPKISTKAKAGTLTALVGATAASLLLSHIPQEESGRKVDVTIAEDGTATVLNVSGKQYLTAYLDIAGVPTACDGITAGVKAGQHFTEAQCAALLEHDLISHAQMVANCAPSLWLPGGDYRRVAAVMLTYNIGGGGFCGSSIRRQFEAGANVAACNSFLGWDKARVNGVLRPVVGLTRRRHREREICLTGLPGYTPETLGQRLRPYM